ncbi:MAG TPA: hypothetical protein VNK70_02080 [Candidatus Paceibacterota bacterium]|nr:hypothetical protein [Candidatus Paceibacterota bacterium]
MRKFSQLLTIIVTVLAVGYWLSTARAQSPTQVIITWQAINFYPADYKGKAAVTPRTPVAVAAEVLKNGKLLDLKKSNFTWLLDEKLLGRGEGLKETSFTAKKPAGDSHLLRLTVKFENESFEKAVRIPVERPRVVVKTGLAKNTVEPGGKINLVAIPYFFNVSSLDGLNFSWEINDEKIVGPSSNQLTLNVGSPQSESQKSIRITSLIQNRTNILESASETVQIKMP